MEDKKMMMKYNIKVNMILKKLTTVTKIWLYNFFIIDLKSAYHWRSFRLFCREIILNILPRFLLKKPLVYNLKKRDKDSEGVEKRSKSLNKCLFTKYNSRYKAKKINMQKSKNIHAYSVINQLRSWENREKIKNSLKHLSYITCWIFLIIIMTNVIFVNIKAICSIPDLIRVNTLFWVGW